MLSEKKQNKTKQKTNRQTDKQAISPCLRCPEDHRNMKRKCPTSFYH